jgi:hypothetical protein
MESNQAKFKALTDSLIPLIDDIMARNKGVSSWEHISEKDVATMQRIRGYYLDEFNFQKAAQNGLISKEHAAKIADFIEWDFSLGDYDI